MSNEEGEEGQGTSSRAVEKAREVFKEANKCLRMEEADSEQRLMLLQHWKQFEVKKMLLIVKSLNLLQ